MAIEPEQLAAAPQPTWRRLGVFGGSFDPIHLGHLIVASEARYHLGLDYVLFVPANVSPFKSGATTFSATDRLAMIELAVAADARLGASRIELDRPGPSYTVDMLRGLRAQHPGAQLHFIMGADSLLTFHLWRQPTEILSLARLAVLKRPGATVDLDQLDRELPGLAAATDIVDTLEIGISSTLVRNRLAQGSPVRYLVPRRVEDYIRSLDLAKEKGANARPSC